MHVETIITDRPLPLGNRVMLREYAGDVEVYIHRPALLADPEGLVRELCSLSDANLRAPDTHWSVAS